MSDSTWNAVDSYYGDLFIGADAALDATLAASAAAGLPPIAVSPLQGKMLHLLARSLQAKAILEIGTLGGYSTIWLARALPRGGRLNTLELNATHAKLARENLQRAGVSDEVEIRVGPALESLEQMVKVSHAPFDLIFIDADKETMAEQFGMCLKLSRSGTVIVADNVVRDGAVVDPASTDSRVQGVRRFNAAVASEQRVSATAVQTVGSKGYDGFAMLYVL